MNDIKTERVAVLVDEDGKVTQWVQRRTVRLEANVGVADDDDAGAPMPDRTLAGLHQMVEEQRLFAAGRQLLDSVKETP